MKASHGERRKYMIYWKYANLKKLRVSVKYRMDHKYFPVPFAFDIETTRIKDPKREAIRAEIDRIEKSRHAARAAGLDEPEEIVQKLPEPENDGAFMYIWMFACGEDLIVYGRTWKEFQDWLLMLQDELQLAHDFQAVIYVHDLRYEFGFCRRYLNIDEGSIVARTQRVIIKFTAGCFEWRDSYSYTEQPLKAMGESIGIPKLPDFDYSKIRLPCTKLSARELEYCENDVKILAKYYQGEVNHYGSLSKTPLTLTKQVHRHISSEMARTCTKHQRWMMAGRQLDAAKEEDYQILKMLRVAYFGGYNYATTLYKGDELSGVLGADIDTCYISQVLLHRFPATKFKKLSGIPDKMTPGMFQDLIEGRHEFSNRALLIHIRAEEIKAKIPELAFLPIYPKNYLNRAPEARRRMKTEHVAECAYIDTVLTDIDFRLFAKWYTWKEGSLKFLEIYASRYMPLPEYVIQSTAELAARKYNTKLALAEVKKERQLTPEEVATYVRDKSICARVYGVFVQDPIRMEYVYNNQLGQVVPAGVTGIEEAAQDLDGNSKRNFSPVMYQWGVWVAAWARKAILDPLYEIATWSPIPQPEGFFNRTVIYSDTDSLYVIMKDNPEAVKILETYNEKTAAAVSKMCKKYGINPDNLRGLGQFRTEYYEKFKVIGLKQYCFIRNGDYDYHISGLPRMEKNEKGEYIKGKFFEKFETAADKMAAVTEDFYVSAEETGVLKSRYIDEERSFCVSDEDGNCMHIEVPSCIILEPQAFKSGSPSLRELIADIDPDKLECMMKRNFFRRGEEDE